MPLSREEVAAGAANRCCDGGNGVLQACRRDCACVGVLATRPGGPAGGGDATASLDDLPHLDRERSYFVGIRMVRQLVDDDQTELCKRIAGQP